VVIEAHQESNSVSTQVLEQNAAQNEVALLAFNATIEGSMAIIQVKIDNVALPASFNLTLGTNTSTILGNGTVVFLNPNAPGENTTLTYMLKEQLGNVYVELGPPSAAFMYSTLGGMNWATLTGWDPPVFANTTFAVSGAVGQILDDQRGKITASPPFGLRRYFGELGEVRLEFDGAVGGAQTLTLNENVEMNLGFI